MSILCFCKPTPFYSMSELKKFEYQGHRISFNFGDGYNMINATEMAKAFNKQINAFFRLKQTAEYVDILHKSLEISRGDDSRLAKIRSYNTENLAKYYPELIKVVRGGNLPQGTWLHERLALKFAAWLSPAFEEWVYRTIHTLLTTGRVELMGQQLGEVTQVVKQLVTDLQGLKDMDEKLIEQLRRAAVRIKAIEAKVLTSEDGYYTIVGYCHKEGIYCHSGAKWGKAAAKLSRVKNISIKEVSDSRFGKVNAYHEDILKQVIPKNS